MDKKEISQSIKVKAFELGFESCGISKAEKLGDHQKALENWNQKGLNASMHYMENNFEKRLDPTLLEVGTQSVISVLINYFPKDQQVNPGVPKIAKYAYGKDYHFVIKDKLKKLLDYINTDLVSCQGRVFTDSAPVLERAWAAKSGLGWIGKNTCLIVPNKGSFFFIGEVLIDAELEYDRPITDYCGTCTKCLNACPTNALVAPYLLDSNRCISYQTIENKGELPGTLKNKFQDWIFGCDICQDVCPWNKFAAPTTEPEFTPNRRIIEMSREDWDNLDNAQFNLLFKKSALMRAKFNGLRRNLNFIET
jgi:epoxyqueuosine reductase